VLSLFSGIDAPNKALTRLGIEHELVNYCETDKYASKAMSLIHGVPETKNLGDITKVDEKTLPDFDLMTWGFPCQDVSIAGERKGLVQGETRSGLYYDGLRILKHKQPKYSLIENVKGLTDQKFSGQLQQILTDLGNAGYTNQMKVLNARDHGIPQNRERVFIVSIRKDINQEFMWPEPMPLKCRFEGLLEDKTKVNNILSEAELAYMNRQVKGGRTHWDFSHHHDTANEVSHCIPANIYKGVPYNVLIDRRDGVKYRKLTPLECFRLMGFDDEDYMKCEGKISNTQLYKMVGNSICVDVLESIFKEMLLCN
jgi:DNA (cytosine-5)-methyltransferase 1